MPGASRVVNVPIPKSQSATQTVNGLIKRCELLGAVELYPTKIESSVYRSVATKQGLCSSFQVFTNSDYPASCFVISDKDQILTCDLAFREFPGLLKGVYEHEQKLQVRGIGKKYRLGDFTTNFISLYLGQSPTVRGVLLEVAFLIAPAHHLVNSFLKLHFPEIRADSIKDPSEASFPQAPPSPRKALLGQSMQSWSNFADRLSVRQMPSLPDVPELTASSVTLICSLLEEIYTNTDDKAVVVAALRPPDLACKTLSNPPSLANCRYYAPVVIYGEAVCMPVIVCSKEIWSFLPLDVQQLRTMCVSLREAVQSCSEVLVRELHSRDRMQMRIQGKCFEIAAHLRNSGLFKGTLQASPYLQIHIERGQRVGADYK
ncbi:unnamed protein product [Dibothriocephalus latus]|uniref:Mediator of RNA polymerase II transcription subunit 20 n=1 Tax=Dibothriocephalus latus TaxID=60516 RepID=A0A3P7LPX1_DIBLA|nr:unnamed protein product [Dibothriocephalus latus]